MIVMKKIFVITSAVVLALILTGCTKKTTTTSTTAPDSTGTSAEPSSAGVATTSTADASAAAAISAQQKAVETALAANFELARQLSASPLSNQGQFCAMTADFASTDMLLKANQAFFFTSAADKMKDWYFVVYFDQLKGKRYRSFAAKKDYADVQCNSSHALPATSFFAAYLAYFSANQGSLINSSASAQTVLTLQAQMWKVNVYDSSGQVIATEQIDASGGATSAAAESATPATTN